MTFVEPSKAQFLRKADSLQNLKKFITYLDLFIKFLRNNTGGTNSSSVPSELRK